MYGPFARNAILETKAHIRALRSEYTASAPIHRRLPPEVLFEVFSNIDPGTVACQRRVSVLYVCRYWRTIISKIPQFWADLLGLPMLNSMNPKWHMGRFRAALSLSAPRSLTLSLPFWSLDMDGIVDVLLPHASRLSSFTIRPISPIAVEPAKRLLEQHIPRLRDLVVPKCSWDWRDPPLTLYFHNYPNIHSLKLSTTVYYAPLGPCTSLRHLKLMDCTIRAWPKPANYVSAMRSVHNSLELFPNLETISLTRSSLSQRDWPSTTPVELSRTIHLPRLRRLEIEDTSIYIWCFLSHLVFPPTTSLVLDLEIVCRPFVEHPMAVPVFPGINPFPDPDAELTFYIDFSFRSTHRYGVWLEGFARWETHGEGVRPVSVAIIGAGHDLNLIAHLTRGLAHALAPPPGRGVTALTVKGSWRLYIDTDSDSPDSDSESEPSAREYWASFLPELAGLRRIVCATDNAAADFIDILGRPLPQNGEFPCPHLVELALVWELPEPSFTPSISEAGSDSSSSSEGPADEDAEVEGLGEEGIAQGAQRSKGYPTRASPERLAEALCALCDAVGACLTARGPHCERIRKLTLGMRESYHWEMDPSDWQVDLVEQQLQDGLGHLVGEIAVVDQVN